MSGLAPNVARIIHDSAVDGKLVFGGPSDWLPLATAWRTATEDAGVYAIGLKLGVHYSRGLSRIVYIGSTVNLKKRFQQQNRQPHSRYVDRLQKRYPGGLLVSYNALPTLPVDWLRGLEDAALQVMKESFGGYPACNEAAIWSKHVETCRPIVDVLPCDGLPFPLTLETLEKQGCVGRGELRKRVKPNSPTPEKKPPQEEDPLDAAQERLYENAGISLDNVATWKVGKIQDVIALCAQLQPEPRTRSKVKRFIVHNRAVPYPHTWGEVALIHARRIAGSWRPTARVWVKVLHEKSLLGEARLEEFWTIARDVADLPQTTHKRRSIRETANWKRMAKSIQGELPSDYQPRQYYVTDVPNVKTTDPETREHLRLLRASASFDMDELAMYEKLDRERQIQWNQYQRVEYLAVERAEAIYRAAHDMI
jgi:hypothetical protein